VPRQLTAEFEDQHVDACQEHLKRSEAEFDGFLGRIVTEDETWVHYHQPETKRTRNAAIPPHQNRKNSVHNHLRKSLC